jgi:Ca2+-binding RTX toxin-like protein
MINLLAGTATNVGSIANTQNATGGGGNDILVGNGLANVLIGGAGNNLVIGGGGAATLTCSGGGSNILISGTTSYDLNAAALQSILALWSNPSNSYAARVAALMSSSFAYHLDATTVFHNLKEHLTGGSGLTLFFARLSGTNKDTTDARTGETVIQI